MDRCHMYISICIYTYFNWIKRALRAREGSWNYIMELYYGIIWGNYITGTYYGIILRKCSTGLYYWIKLRNCITVILRDNITELYHGIILGDYITGLHYELYRPSVYPEV